MSEIFSTKGLGWKRDRSGDPDFTLDKIKKDVQNQAISLDEKKVAMKIQEEYLLHVDDEIFEGEVDLRRHCSPIKNQGSIGSNTANAAIGLLEYYELKNYQKYTNYSSLFLYKVTRQLLNWEGDTGAFLSTTIKAMELIGILPAEYYTYKTSQFDEDIRPIWYNIASNYKVTKSLRLDSPKIDPNKLLNRVKGFLKARIPSMFGFYFSNSLFQAPNDGNIPFLSKDEKIMGGHAVAAVGFNDDKVIKNHEDGTVTKGALLIRNSWGKEWGEEGYGWLPYKYVEEKLSNDWWVIIEAELKQNKITLYP
ncbi:MAG: C1 family peptidase [Candidatus Hodarchaeota archaeon]